MSLSMVELMKQPEHDLAGLQNALHAAMKLELATLPPYLCGYWALKDKTSYPATQLNDIVYQEMLHFGLACNMFCATPLVGTSLRSASVPAADFLGYWEIKTALTCDTTDVRQTLANVFTKETV